MFAATMAVIAALAQLAHGNVGVSAVLLRTNEAISFHGDDQFPMQGVYTFPIAMAVLDRVDHGLLNLDQAGFRELLHSAVSENDGTASDVLMQMAGGATHIQAFMRGLGIRYMDIVTTEAQMAQDDRQQYRNWVTPKAAAQLLRIFDEGQGLSPASRDLLMNFMIKTETGPKRIKAGLPPGAMLAHKTGTSGAATNDIGLITLPNGDKVALAVFVSDSTAPESTRERVIAEIAKAVCEWATGQ
jgi:beta-lactamase class A